MILQVFSVYDKAVALYMPPIFLRSENEAVRALRVAMGGEHAFRDSPADYVLYHLGAFQEESGEFFLPEGMLGPRLVCELALLVKKED